VGLGAVGLAVAVVEQAAATEAAVEAGQAAGTEVVNRATEAVG